MRTLIVVLLSCFTLLLLVDLTVRLSDVRTYKTSCAKEIESKLAWREAALSCGDLSLRWSEQLERCQHEKSMCQESKHDR